MDYTLLIDLGLTFLSKFLAGSKDQLPAEVVTALQAAVDALDAHKADLVTKANLEALRG